MTLIKAKPISTALRSQDEQSVGTDQSSSNSQGYISRGDVSG
jgi:hypothetical protein